MSVASSCLSEDSASSPSKVIQLSGEMKLFPLQSPEFLGTVQTYTTHPDSVGNPSHKDLGSNSVLWWVTQTAKHDSEEILDSYFDGGKQRKF